jgi:hypothetical protein
LTSTFFNLQFETRQERDAKAYIVLLLPMIMTALGLSMRVIRVRMSNRGVRVSLQAIKADEHVENLSNRFFGDKARKGHCERTYGMLMITLLLDDSRSVRVRMRVFVRSVRMARCFLRRTFGLLLIERDEVNDRGLCQLTALTGRDTVRTLGDCFLAGLGRAGAECECPPCECCAWKAEEITCSVSKAVDRFGLIQIGVEKNVHHDGHALP